MDRLHFIKTMFGLIGIVGVGPGLLMGRKDGEGRPCFIADPSWESKYGVKVHKIETPTGTMHVIYHPLLS